MRLNVAGVLTDYRGRVLLRQTGAKTLAPVRRAVEQGILPAETLARAFRQETGLIVLPVRLVGLHYDAGRPGGELTFWFRCTMRGGDLLIPPGGQPAGFFDLPLPAALLAADKRQIEAALRHAEGSPNMEQAPTGLGGQLGRLFGRREVEDSSEEWRVQIAALAGATDAPVEWALAEPGAADTLPADPDRPPWMTAERLLRPAQATEAPPIRLARVEQAPDRPVMRLFFAPSESKAVI